MYEYDTKFVFSVYVVSIVYLRQRLLPFSFPFPAKPTDRKIKTTPPFLLLINYHYAQRLARRSLITINCSN